MYCQCVSKHTFSLSETDHLQNHKVCQKLPRLHVVIHHSFGWSGPSRDGGRHPGWNFWYGRQTASGRRPKGRPSFIFKASKDGLSACTSAKIIEIQKIYLQKMRGLHELGSRMECNDTLHGSELGPQGPKYSKFGPMGPKIFAQKFL